MAKYSPEQKAAVMQRVAALQADGLSITEAARVAAREHGMPFSTAFQWMKYKPVAGKYPPEMQEAAVRRFAEVRPNHSTDTAALRAVADERGLNPTTLRHWVADPRNAEISGWSPRQPPTPEAQRLAAVDRVFQQRPTHGSDWAAIRAVGSELGIKPNTLAKWVVDAGDLDNVVGRRRGVGISAVLSLAAQHVLNQGRWLTVRDAAVKHQIAELKRRVFGDARRVDLRSDTPGVFARSYALRAVTPAGGRTPVGVVYGGPNVALQAKAGAVLADSAPLGYLMIADRATQQGRSSSLVDWINGGHNRHRRPAATWVHSPLAEALQRGQTPVVVAGRAAPDGDGFLVEVMDRPWRAGFGSIVPQEKYRTTLADSDEFFELLWHDRHLAAALKAHPDSPVLLKMQADAAQLQTIADSVGRDVYAPNGVTHTFTLSELQSTGPWALPMTVSDAEFDRMRASMAGAPAQLRDVAAANGWSVTAVWAEPKSTLDDLLLYAPGPPTSR